MPRLVLDEPNIPAEPGPKLVPDLPLRLDAPAIPDPQDISLEDYSKQIVSTAGQTGTSLAEAENQIKQKEELKQGFLSKTAKAWQRADESVNIDFIWADVHAGRKSREEAEQLTKEFRQRVADNPIEARNWAEKLWLKTVAVANPMLAGQFKGLTYGAIGAGIAGLGGQAGPQIAAPEEILTVPGLFKAGHIWGTFSYWAEQGTGSIYREATEAGVPDKTAKLVAAIGGPAYGAVEFSQVDRLIPGIGRVKRPLVSLLLKYLKTVGTEVAEEGVQKTITEGSTLLGKMIEGMISASELPGEVKKIAVASYRESKEALDVMALLAGGSMAVEIVTAKKGAGKKKKPFEVGEEERKAEALRRQEEGLLPDVVEDEFEAEPVATEERVKALEPISLSGGEFGGIVIHPSARAEGKVQATSFTKEGKLEGHQEYNTLEDALLDNIESIEDPVFAPLKKAENKLKLIKAWEKAKFDSPLSPEAKGKKFAYVSPLRPLSGVSNLDGVVIDVDRVGVVFTNAPLDVAQVKHLSLVPITPEAQRTSVADYIKENDLLAQPSASAEPTAVEGEVYYHVTNVDNIESIKKKGLQVGSYVTNRLEDAEAMRDIMADEHEVQASIIKLHLTPKQISSLTIDKSQPNAYKTHEIIQPPAPAEPTVAPTVVEAAEPWKQTIETSLAEAAKLKPVIAAEKTAELKKRVGRMAGTMKNLREKGVRPEEAIGRSTGALRGPLASYDLRFEPIRDKLTKEQEDAAFDSIIDSKKLPPLTKRQTQVALSKLLDGSYLRLFESDLITDHFGLKMGKEARRRVPWGDSWTRTLAEYIGIPRTMLTALSGDMSGIMRQARPLGQAYPVEFADFVVKSAQAWASEKALQRMDDASLDLPFIDEAIRDGVLEGTSYGEAVGEPIRRGEEFIGAGPLEKIPGIKIPIKAAERAFTVLNVFRRAVYSRVRTEATRTGTDAMSETDRKRIASIINDMSGRAHLKRTKAIKAILPYTQALFAPRFRIARMRAPLRLPVEAARFGRRLATGERLNLPELRMTAGAFSSMIATNLLLMALVKTAYIAWGSAPEDLEMEMDLRSTDGGKIRIKDARIDLWAGFLQDAQTYVQLATGQAKSQSGELYDIDRVDVLKRAIRKRTRPFVSLAVDALTGETVSGKRFGAPPKGKEGKLLQAWEVPEWLQGASVETWERVVPLVAQDATDALIIEGVPEAITMAVLSHFGISVAVYEKWATAQLKELKNEVAMSEHGKTWSDLSKKQQERLQPQFEELEVRVGQERPLRPRSKYISKKEEALKERMYRAMPKQVKDSLYNIGLDVGTISKFNVLGIDELNDTRYAYYEERTVKQLQSSLSRLYRRTNYSYWSLKKQREETKKTINEAKKKARDDVYRKYLR